MKKPKLHPPEGTTFDFKGVDFVTPFFNTFPLHGGLNLDLNRLNPAPPWRSCFKRTQAGPQTKEAQLHPQIISISGAKTESKTSPLVSASRNHDNLFFSVK